MRQLFCFFFFLKRNHNYDPTGLFFSPSSSFFYTIIRLTVSHRNLLKEKQTIHIEIGLLSVFFLFSSINRLVIFLY